MKKKVVLLVGILLVSLNGSRSHANVLASIRPIGFIVAAIASGVTETSILVRGQESPHHYAFKPSDLAQIRQAELFVWISPHFEQFLEKTLHQSNKAAPRQLRLSTLPTIAGRLLHRTDPKNAEKSEPGSCCEHKVDLHIWLSPEIGIEIATAVHEVLVDLYPHKKGLLDDNLDQFKKSVDKGRGVIEALLSSVHQIPYVVFHDAYYYFEKAFNLNHAGQFTIHSILQPGIRTLANIRNQLKQKAVYALFSEPQFDSRLLSKLAAATNAQLGTLDPLGLAVPINKGAYVHFLQTLALQFQKTLLASQE